jgi:hypothetical protein
VVLAPRRSNAIASVFFRYRLKKASEFMSVPALHEPFIRDDLKAELRIVQALEHHTFTVLCIKARTIRESEDFI